MISDETIKQLQAAVETKILKDSEDNEFSTRPLNALPDKKFPEPASLWVATLTGFIDYVNARSGDLENADKCIIHVASHRKVNLVSNLYGSSRQRDIFMSAAFEELLGKSFSFGTYYDHESFIVALQTLFVDTPERRQILKVIGTIKESSVRETSDDGVSQAVTAKAGVALVTEVAIPNPVELRPFRTFRELAQPMSLFVLRVRSQEGSKPACALFEADGGKWKLDAIELIKAYLDGQHFTIPIIA